MKIAESPLRDLRPWREGLGLLPVPLFGTRFLRERYVLLNGNQGNMCLDLRVGDYKQEDPRSWAWSSDVGHYVRFAGDDVVLHRWDRSHFETEHYQHKFVADNLPKFYEYIEKEQPKRELSVVAHVTQIFRSLRNGLGGDYDGFKALKAFLVLLACSADKVDRKHLSLGSWGLKPEAVRIATEVQGWDTFLRGLTDAREYDGLKPEPELILRHASGQIFQDAHYHAMLSPQLTLGLFLPIPAMPKRERGAREGVGVHFTPPSIARVLVEEAFRVFHDGLPRAITIFDPACGSGEFLRESLRQLNLRRYKGTVRLVGWDLSTAACDMADFVLSWERRSWTGGTVEIEILNANSLDGARSWPDDADVILMNPPFLSWEDMDIVQKEALKTVLGEFVRRRVDYSSAFILKAAQALRNKQGVLATVAPASFLDSDSSAGVRDAVASVMSPVLLARLGSHTLFPNALIDAALYVGRYGRNRGEAPLALWAGYRQTSTSSAFRSLRRLRYLGIEHATPEYTDIYSVYENRELGKVGAPWSPRPFKAWSFFKTLGNVSKVADLFVVHQGVRTGNNSVFIIARGSLQALPEKERRYFRPAIVNKSISNGSIKDDFYVWYPYAGGKCIFKQEAELRANVDTFYRTYLLPNKDALVGRKSLAKTREQWWGLIWPREWQSRRTPKLVSTFFGGAGSFAWDATGDYVVVQGHAWSPRADLEPKANWGLRYLSLLNSPLIEDLLSAVSNNVSGGQWDLAPRFVNSLPMPNLFGNDVDTNLIKELESTGRMLYKGLDIDTDLLNDLARRAFGIG